MVRPERSVYTAQDFLHWRAANSLELTPKFQRRGVWSSAARSFFIDTLIRMMPVPPIYIRRVQAKGAEGLVNEVIDGQQRVSAVLDFIDGKYSLSKNLSSEWAGKGFRDLSPPYRQAIMNHSFSTEI